MKPRLIFCMGGQDNRYAKQAIAANWEYGFRSREKCLDGVTNVTMIDVDWKKYDLDAHVQAVSEYRPWISVCPDIEDPTRLTETLEAMYRMREAGSEHVMVVPKADGIIRMLPAEQWIVLGYPIGPGEGTVNIWEVKESNFPVHLLGGSLPGQLKTMYHMNPGQVISGDMNGYTKAAQFGNTMQGLKLIKHPGKRHNSEGNVYEAFGVLARHIYAQWQQLSVDVGSIYERPQRIGLEISA